MKITHIKKFLLLEYCLVVVFIPYRVSSAQAHLQRSCDTRITRLFTFCACVDSLPAAPVTVGEVYLSPVGSSASVHSTSGSTKMLKLAVFLTLATVCFAQPPTPKIPESFMSAVSCPNTCMLIITCVSLAFPLHRVGWNTMTIVEPFLANVSKIFHATSRYALL